ncbi:1-aminocyclopropane-1-carboxylate deaminase/D-cysteine desulfhydrase [Thalassotalea aquiviva]|uniref:1-aminocyclopropane-1-carboxylate deaminase/D-cysteine desulfhydrase n=1 Tax=Thalassotalea aquiviva TaxID=3242415 RepID=UPI00352A1A35
MPKLESPLKILSPIVNIDLPCLKKHKITLIIKRDDCIHPIISGNKWRKLKYNLVEAKAQNKSIIISFGGAFSNHIHALAYAGKVHGIKTLAIIRGEPEYQSNFTLTQARKWGMTLKFVDRATYKLRQQESYQQQLLQQYPNSYLVPEGGSNQLALPGVGEVISELNQQTNFDYLLTPVGSGGTLAGLVKADANQHHLLGIAVLKHQGYLNDEVNTLLQDNELFTNWQILDDFHCGGYGKFTAEQAEKIRAFSLQTNVPFEPVYSGKMVLAFLTLLEQGYFKPNSKVVLLHTGGLQGLGGLCERGILDKAQWPVPNFNLA